MVRNHLMERAELFGVRREALSTKTAREAETTPRTSRRASRMTAQTPSLSSSRCSESGWCNMLIHSAELRNE